MKVLPTRSRHGIKHTWYVPRNAKSSPLEGGVLEKEPDMAKDPRIELFRVPNCLVRVPKVHTFQGRVVTGTWQDPIEVAPGVKLERRYQYGMTGTKIIVMYNNRDGMFRGKEVINLYFKPATGKTEFALGTYIVADVVIYEKTSTREVLDKTGHPVIDRETGENKVFQSTFRYVDIEEVTDQTIKAAHYVRFEDKPANTDGYQIAGGISFCVYAPQPYNSANGLFEYTCTTCGNEITRFKPFLRDEPVQCSTCKPPEYEHHAASRTAASQSVLDQLITEADEAAINSALGSSTPKRPTLGDIAKVTTGGKDSSLKELAETLKAAVG